MPFLSGFWAATLTTAGLNAIITMGLYFSNSAGALSVAHAALAGIGGYVGAVLTTNFGWPFPLAIVAGMVVGFSMGAFLAAVTLQMNELVAGLTTLAFGETLVVIAFNVDYIGGANSFSGIPLRTTLAQVYLVLAAVLFAAFRFEGSRLGLAAEACRHTPVAAAAMGIDVTRVKVLVFAIGAAIAALGGVLRAHYVLVQSPEDMAFWESVNYTIFWVFGGSQSFCGPAVGAIVLTIMPELLRFSVQERFILYGLLLVVMVILRPQGVITRVPLGRPPALLGLFNRAKDGGGRWRS